MAKKVPETGREALYLVDNDMFLHLQKVDGGCDYTIHDDKSKIHMSGGHISDQTIAQSPHQNYLKAARMEIYSRHDIHPRQTERINPIIAGEFYKNQILKASWELDSRIESMIPDVPMNSPDSISQPQSNLFNELQKQSDRSEPNRPNLGSLDVLLGNDIRKEEVTKRDSVLNQLKEPIKPAIKVKPHRKTKETPSL